MKNLYFLLLFASFTSCHYESSNVVGWDYNDPMNGGFKKVPYEEQETGPGLILIEGGTFEMYLEQSSSHSQDSIEMRVAPYYIDEAEVSNGDWCQYMEWINKVYGDEYRDLKLKTLPDTTVWTNNVEQSDFYNANYLRSPSYANYPVVGVSWIQANDYCNWRTDRVNEYILIREKIIKGDYEKGGEPFTTEGYFSGQYDEDDSKLPDLDPAKGGYNPVTRQFSSKEMATRVARMEDGILLPRYRLPTELEWEYASSAQVSSKKACKDLPLRKYNHKVEIVPFLSKQTISNEYLIDPASFPLAPIYSGCPNDYGLYNMAGNVSEWVDQPYVQRTRDSLEFIYHIDREVDYNISKIYNHFWELRNEVEAKGLDSLTLNISSILVDDLQHIVDQNNNGDKLDAQYQIEDFIDNSFDDLMYRAWGWEDYYSDTTWETIIPPYIQNFKENLNLFEVSSTEKYIYSDPRFRSYVIDSSLMPKPIQTSNYIYKGGNWADSTMITFAVRRNMRENASSALLGFRCAMDRVGYSVGLSKKRKK